MTEQAWHALSTYTGHERQVWRALADLELNPYLPTIRNQLELKPRFPGYCFWQAGSWRDEHWHAIHRIRGTLAILTDNGCPAVIPHSQLIDPLFADLLDAIRQAEPRNLLFPSRRKRRAEARLRAHLANLRKS